MNITNAYILWTPDRDEYSRDPTRGKVEVRTEPSAAGFAYCIGVGAINGEHPSSEEALHLAQLAMLFLNFHTLVVRDGIDPAVAHRAFLYGGLPDPHFTRYPPSHRKTSAAIRLGYGSAC